VFEGFVSLDESSAPKPIKIVRDTGCGRSVILEGTLPFNEDSSAGVDLAGGKVFPDPIVTEKPCMQEDEQEKEIFPVCAVTRAMSRKAVSKEDSRDQIDDFSYNLEDTFVSK